MTVADSTLSTLFFVLLAFYVCLQCLLMIIEVRTAENLIRVVPAAFRNKVSIAEHRKSVDYAAEVLQSDLLIALAGVFVVVLLTFGKGFDLLLAATTVIAGPNLWASFLFGTVLSLALALIHIPLTWWRDFHINERYGYERTRSHFWLRTRWKELFIGWLTLLPLMGVMIFILGISSSYWWVFCFICSVLYFSWRWIVAPDWYIAFSKSAQPIENPEIKQALTQLLTYLGHHDVEIMHIERPNAWRHGHAVFARRGTQKRLVIFDHALTQLPNPEDICALAAAVIGRATHYHDLARWVFFVSLSFLFWWGLSELVYQPAFYQALHIEPGLAIPNGNINPALIAGIVVTLTPILCYPLIFVIHGFTRFLKYDEDAFAVKIVGARRYVRAISNIYTDHRHTLQPNRFYSWANHSRPHVTLRIQAALLVEQRAKKLHQRAQNYQIEERANRFNAIIKQRQAQRENQKEHLLQTKNEQLIESQTHERMTQHRHKQQTPSAADHDTDSQIPTDTNNSHQS